MLCTRCHRRPRLAQGLLCRACELELKARPRATTYDRTPPPPRGVDYWSIAQDLLCPDTPYRAIDHRNRVRITRLARAMALIPYEWPEPLLDAEQQAFLVAHRLVGRVVTPGTVDEVAVPDDSDDEDDDDDDDDNDGLA